MAFTKYQVFLVVLLVATGSINTLTTKWTDRLKAENSAGKVVYFQHPFVQACSMFIGEIMCLVVFKILYFYYSRKQDGSIENVGLVKGNQNFNPFVLLPPALCDMCLTSLMYIGLNLTYASSFQMLRGLVVVGLSDLGAENDKNVTGISEEKYGFMKGSGNHSTSDIILGDALVIGAQALAAVQMVWEEKFVAGLDIPALQAVGWEGVFGFVVLGTLQIPFYYIHVPPPYSANPHNRLEDVPDAFVQMGHEPLIIIAVTGTILSIAFFNFAGISVTKEISATTRMVLDSVRTLVIWVCTLGLRWQPFHWLQVVGFIIFLIGMCVYNNILIPKLMSCIPCQRNTEEQDEERLISAGPTDQPTDEVPQSPP
ncbi:Solute carrier family 35 member F6 [Gryllus bimaculatus]|nr:Solute carrier family 35 member F6 [Gryllus bimaculatus]